MIRGPRVRAGTWALLAIAGGLLLLSLPLFPIDLQAWGNNLAATAVLGGGPGLAHPESAACDRRRLASGGRRATT